MNVHLNNKSPILHSKCSPLQITNRLQQLQDNKLIDLFIAEVKNLISEDYNFSELTKLSFDVLTRYKERLLVLKKIQNLNMKLKQSLDSWTVNKINEHSYLAVRILEKTHIQMRYQGSFNTNIENICIIMQKTKFYKEWIPFCCTSKDIKQLGISQKIAYIEIKIPLLSTRYSYLHGLGLDRISHNGTIIINGQGISNTELKQKYQIQIDEKQKNAVQLKIQYFTCEISHKNDNEYIFKVFTQIDSSMPSVPPALLNYVMKYMGGFIFEKITKIANNFKGTIWQLDSQKNPQFNQWLHQKIFKWSEQEQNQSQSK